MADLEWSLRYGNPEKGELLLAASIIAAYRQMVGDTQKKRSMVVSELRKGPNLPPNKSLEPERANSCAKEPVCEINGHGGGCLGSCDESPVPQA
jgi:hypothetical protein